VLSTCQRCIRTGVSDLSGQDTPCRPTYALYDPSLFTDLVPLHRPTSSFDATFLPRPSGLRDLCALLCRSNFSPKPPSGPFQITTERSAQKDTAQRSLRFNLELRTPNLQRHPAKSRMGKFLCPNACFVGLGTSPKGSPLEAKVLSSHTLAGSEAASITLPLRLTFRRTQRILLW